MKYLKIDLKTIRLQSRQFQAENPRLFLVYLLPSILLILSGFLNPLERINESVLEQPFLSVFGHVFQAYLFPLLVSFIGAILLTSSVYTTLKLIKNPDTELSVKNSLTLFNEAHFSQTFLTLLLKRFYLFLWSIPSLLGIYFLFYSSFLAKKFVVLHPEFPNLDLTSIETERFLMKGYKFQRFILDLQLLPWYFLNWITFGIASFSLLPYIQINKMIFYRAVLARKRPKA